MARGGSRPGERRGGRRKGTPNKDNAARAAEIAASGETPLEYMIRTMRDPAAKYERRDWAAGAAAPYVHPRLSQIESKSEHVHRYVARVPEKAQTVETWQDQHTPPEQTTTH